MAKYPFLELIEHSPDHAALKTNYKGHYTLLCTENICIHAESFKKNLTGSYANCPMQCTQDC